MPDDSNEYTVCEDSMLEILGQVRQDAYGSIYRAYHLAFLMVYPDKLQNNSLYQLACRIENGLNR